MVLEQVTGMIAAVFDTAFAPIIALNPVLSLFLVTLIITLITIAFNVLLSNKSVLRGIKDSMEELREKMTVAQKSGDSAALNKLVGDMMSLNSQYMKHTSKSLIASLIVILLFSFWVGLRYQAMELQIPFLGYTIKSITLPILGTEVKAWLIWYFLVSFAIGWVLRKVLGFD
jgi:uncharacterized membrane protein (DUF106 family)